MTAHIPKPDVVARIRLFASDEGGRKRPLLLKSFGCPLYFGDDGFDCRLFLEATGQVLSLGESAEVPIRFLRPDLAKQHVAVGRRFRLWDAGFFAEGEIIDVVT